MPALGKVPTSCALFENLKNQDVCLLQVGNALTDDYHDHLGVFQFLWSAGLISDETYKLLNLLCDFQPFIHSSNSCDKILDIASKELGNIDAYSIYTPACQANGSQSNQLRKRIHVSITSKLFIPFKE